MGKRNENIELNVAQIEKEKEVVENEIFECSIETKFKSVINNNNNNDNSLKTSLNKKEKISNRIQNLDNLIHFSNLTSKKIDNVKNNEGNEVSSKK